MGVRPVIHMYKEKDDANPAETVQVGGWSKETIEDYIKTNLAQQS